MSQTILVTGAAGRIGSETVSALLSKGISVKAASRQMQKLASRPGLQPVFMDYADAPSIAAAIKGTDGALLVVPPLDFEAAAKAEAFLRVAAAQPGYHVVFISAFGVDQADGAPLRVVEKMIMASGVHYTILRPNFFMENFLFGSIAQSILKSGAIVLAADQGRTSFIAASDIGAVAAESFSKKLYDREANLTGPDALDHHEVARLISQASGKTVTYTALPEEGLNQGMRSAGVPEPVIQYLGLLYAPVRAGYMAAISDDVRQITGRVPMSFSTFAKQHADAWR
jgi:uncharacterized protein YbjT (DUF2867 family)